MTRLGLIVVSYLWWCFRQSKNVLECLTHGHFVIQDYQHFQFKQQWDIFHIRSTTFDQNYSKLFFKRKAVDMYAILFIIDMFYCIIVYGTENWLGSDCAVVWKECWIHYYNSRINLGPKSEVWTCLSYKFFKNEE